MDTALLIEINGVNGAMDLTRGMKGSHFRGDLKHDLHTRLRQSSSAQDRRFG